ncbi:hypothetical protein QR680_002346 [Steinernema hermaphroditum]|uniref:Peptidase S1 domain-containing protein n=1 Tax=Steinernema hermaphroditum TaxID=289476 RepID=A0AA39H396_9BILA|nr:hypothetical protein QR680_002346 [Steinernema hermaphroditum]
MVNAALLNVTFLLVSLFAQFGAAAPPNKINETDEDVAKDNHIRKLDNAIQRSPNFIIGGNPVMNDRRWPWQVRIEYLSSYDQKTYLCGGTLVSRRHVMTAAHCTIDMVKQASYAFMGLISLNEGSSDMERKISKITTHPQYNPNTFHADIAILELTKDVFISGAVQTVQLRFDDAPILDSVGTAVVTGWGIWNPALLTKPSNYLRMAEIPLISHDVCKTRWDNLTPRFDIDSGMLCAGAIGKGTGMGDSGGPLLAYYNDTYIQIGLTSFGENDKYGLEHQDTYPGVYTRVSKYCSFISDASDGMARCDAQQTVYFLAILAALVYNVIFN